MKRLTLKIHETGSSVSDAVISTINGASYERLIVLYKELRRHVENFNDETKRLDKLNTPVFPKRHDFS